MKQILYLFLDTNLFIQCRALEELDWSAWAGFEEVHLIASRPVQREIDNQKNRGNHRVGRRARKAYQLFRRVLESEQNQVVFGKPTPKSSFFWLGRGSQHQSYRTPSTTVSPMTRSLVTSMSIARRTENEMLACSPMTPAP